MSDLRQPSYLLWSPSSLS
uniref:Uncharacterized protein n=1 Tax=Arundo donax TaxID=35708 RepID=A0A0A9CI92_ARUDO